MQFTTVLRFLSCAALAATARSQTLLGSVSGGASEHFGTAVISAGFQDGDAYADLLVGAPNVGGGTVRCISGRYLATGVGPSILWTLTVPLAGSLFGAALVDVGNLTGNSANDFVVGAPGYKVGVPSSPPNGALFLVDGSTHSIAATIYGLSNMALGEVVVSVGDQNGDGKTEIATTSRALNVSSASAVYVIQGSAISGTKSVSVTTHSVIDPGANEFGEALASGFDLDGDGLQDLAIGSPRMLGGNGRMSVYSADDAFTTLATYSGTGLGHMGASISARHDYDGDGVVDFVVGAPNWSTDHATEDGRAVVLSGAKLRSNTLPFELATYSLTPGGVATHHFGAAVCASPDLNGDGIGDFLIGAPEYHTVFPLGSVKGAVFIYSGATLTKMTSVAGANDEHLGDEILGAFQDVDGDSFPDFVVAGSASDNPSSDCGVVKLYRMFPGAPISYCVGKLNSQGCTPFMGSSGVPSASSSAPFLLSCANALNQVSGLFFYSNHPTATAFQGGTLCVHIPLTRSAVQASGGSSSGSDCTGAFSLDFGARIQSGVDPALVAGAEVCVQCWSRDPASPSTTSLSDGRRFLINP